MTTVEENAEVIPEFNAQSKFLPVEGPLQQLPHKCAACYRYDNPDPDREGHLNFVTWNQDIEYYGVVFICTDCLREIVNQLGWATEEQVNRAKNWIMDLQSQVHQLTMENVNLRNAVGNLSVVAADRVIASIDRASVLAPVESSEEANDGEGGGTDSTDDTVNELPAAYPKSDGSDDESGSTDVRDDDDLSKLLEEL